mgnify:CR=1
MLPLYANGSFGTIILPFDTLAYIIMGARINKIETDYSINNFIVRVQMTGNF